MSNQDINVSEFLSIETPRDLARFLHIDYYRLVYRVYKTSDDKKYKVFTIRKKDGSERIIRAPISPIKNTQKKLSRVFNKIYKPNDSVFGFVPEKNIYHNARVHSKKKNVLNIDLKDFFPSFNFGRVRGIFLSYPFNFNSDIATLLAQICIHENELPQGSPSSPILTNIICLKMDKQIKKLAKQNKCNYTRYADDLTFSTSMRQFPKEIIENIDQNNKVRIGDELLKIIEDNGFVINNKKTCLKKYYQSQRVTGLVVNQFPNVRRKYIRNIRAMLHAWEKYGYYAAEKTYFELYDRKQLSPDKTRGSFKNVIKGKLAFLNLIRERSKKKAKFKAYDNLRTKYQSLSPLKKIQINIPVSSSMHIMTEGKSDWKHIKAALQTFNKDDMYLDYMFTFEEYGENINIDSGQLLNYCRHLSTYPQDVRILCLFDSDVEHINREVTSADNNFKNWGNNVYSAILPTPNNRSELSKISIELYYTDSDIKTKDSNNRRLFLNNEFDKKTLQLLVSSKVHCIHPNIIGRNYLSVIDDGVIYKDKDVALPKNNYAEYILNQEEGFDDFDISEFKLIFDIFEEVYNLE